MNIDIYITEPFHTNLEQLLKVLDRRKFKITLGSPDFTKNSEDIEKIDVLLIKSQTTVDKNIKSFFPSLKHIIRAGTGLDNIDLDYCMQNSIEIHSAPGANSDSVADYTLMMMLYAIRKVNLINDTVIKSWDRQSLLGDELSNKAIGIIGYGNIGKKVNDRLNSFGVKKVLVYDPVINNSKYKNDNVSVATTIDEVLYETDIITLHLPLNNSTRHLIDEKALKKIKDYSVIINSARGGLVDELALFKQLDDKNLLYIADTVETEPKPNKDMLRHPRVILTPHIAGYTVEAREKSLALAVNNFLESID